MYIQCTVVCGTTCTYVPGAYAHNFLSLTAVSGGVEVIEALIGVLIMYICSVEPLFKNIEMNMGYCEGLCQSG